MKINAKVLRAIGITQFVIISKADAPPNGRVILLTGKNRATNAKVGDVVQLEQTEHDGRVSYKAVG